MVDDSGIKYESVSSSNVAAVGYDPDSQNLFVRFLGKDAPGLKYVYYHVPARVFAELMAAESKGKYLAAHVKGVYSYDRIGTVA